MSTGFSSGSAEDTRGVVRTEVLAPGPAEALAGLLDTAAPDDALPPLWHWVYLLDRPRQDDLGDDGHALHATPAPPGPGFKRMFAGGRVTTYSPLRIGEPATRTTRITAAVEKAGRSGPLRFVTARDSITQSGELRIVDERDIVYRPAESKLRADVAATAPADLPALEAQLALDVDPVLLFRFSALTYNAHRIHYDRDYARVEGYPDLVVHGPLQAMLMGELLREHAVTLIGKQFSYRLLAPTFGAQRLTATARLADPEPTARVRDQAGKVTANSWLTFAAPASSTVETAP